MTDHTVIRFPHGQATPATGTDTAALNDIHAIMCRRGGWTPDTLADVADVLARCGRPVMDVLDIHAAVTETPVGLPQARIDAGTTSVLVRQDQSGGLTVAITIPGDAATTTDETGLTVTLNERQLHPAASR